MGLIPWRNKEQIPVRKEAANGNYPHAQFRREVDTLFENFFENSLLPFAGMTKGGWMPSLDVSEDEKGVTVTVEMPGIERNDIDISVTGSSLVIRGEKKEEKEDKRKDYYRSERRFGSFRREVELPDEIDSDSIEADFKNGVLRVRAKKVPTTPAKRIPIFET